jgi:membrane protein implicated in regulation of membrane protease activity
MAVLLLIESFTLGLTTVWFAGGALAATLTSLVTSNIWVQFSVFIAVSFVLLIFTRPWAVKYINADKTKTNYEGLIGKVIKITGQVDNFNQKGTALVNGTEWTVRSQDANIIIESGEKAQIVDIVGVKLIVKPYQEEEN